MASPFAEGQLVRVVERRWPGMNKAGGVARVAQVNEDSTLAVSYVVGNLREASVEVKVSSPRALLLPLPLLLLLLVVTRRCAAVFAVEIWCHLIIVGCVSLQIVESDFDFCFWSSLEPSTGSRVAV